MKLRARHFLLGCGALALLSLAIAGVLTVVTGGVIWYAFFDRGTAWCSGNCDAELGLQCRGSASLSVDGKVVAGDDELDPRQQVSAPAAAGQRVRCTFAGRGPVWCNLRVGPTTLASGGGQHRAVCEGVVPRR